jgi:thymidylate synthase (FAD)
MRRTEPKVYVVASTKIEGGLARYLEDIGVGEEDWKSDTPSDGDTLTEVAGRVCYRSWMPWNPDKPDASNPNVERVRHGNRIYVGNILKQGHGSVLEHVNVSVIFRDVSRVFTHELVRHRAGMGYSQESLRFVRLNDIKAWVPPSLGSVPPSEDGSTAEDIFTNTIKSLEAVQTLLADVADVDSKPFGLKKKLTSLFRRLAPLGLATTILATGNLRAWRHIIAMRTSGGAEEEMQLVIPPLAETLREMYPACFQDMVVADDGSYTFGSPKV